MLRQPEKMADAVENGTCATAVPLFKAKEEDMRTRDTNDAFDHAPLLSLQDIELTPKECERQREYLIHTVLRIAVLHGGDDLQKHQNMLAETQPVTHQKIEPHKSELYPLPTMNIDESSTMGNAEVINAIMKELNIPLNKDEFVETIKLISGDQLSIARLRAVAAERAGNEGGATALHWAIFVPGLFHYKMAATHGIIVTHLGLTNRDRKNPASLAAHNNFLQRKPIILTSLPPFQMCRDLIFVSLYARVLHCLLLVSKKATLQDYAKDLTWEKLKADASTVVDQFADTATVLQLRTERENDNALGDMVFENAVLFMRDSLLLHEFTNAVKCGDSGRVVLVLKVWARSFRGQGRLKYAQEVLYFLHNITHVWPPSLR
jgi:hypothetical protein